MDEAFEALAMLHLDHCKPDQTSISWANHTTTQILWRWPFIGGNDIQAILHEQPA